MKPTPTRHWTGNFEEWTDTYLATPGVSPILELVAEYSVTVRQGLAEHRGGLKRIYTQRVIEDLVYGESLLYALLSRRP